MQFACSMSYVELSYFARERTNLRESSAASSRELRVSFGDFDFLRYNEKIVVRLEHHFLSYRVKGPLEHRKEVLPWKIAEL